MIPFTRYSQDFRGDFVPDENGPWVKAEHILPHFVHNFSNLVEVESLLLEGVRLITDSIEYSDWPEAQSWAHAVDELGLDYIEGVSLDE